MRRTLAVVALALIPAVSQASVIQWTDWTGSDLSTTTGSLGGVGVTFTATGPLTFAQLGTVSGPDYWLENSPAPYTGNPVVGNRPPGYELLAFNLASTNKLSFDSPVKDPVMAIVSMGQFGGPVTYDFDTPFTVLSNGWGYWGFGSYALGAGDVLIGTEFHGVIQFTGTISEINWTSTEEYWHGFTVGAPVPEPGTMGLLVAGLVGLGRKVRNRRR